MSFIHHKSCECAKTELDLFSLPPTQTSVDAGKWVQYKPIASLTDDSPIEFVVPGHSEEYTDLSQTLLHLVARIVHQDGTEVTAAENVTDAGPTNNWLHSLFCQVDVQLNNKLVTPQSNTYAYRAYLENLLNYDQGAKATHLHTVLFAADTAGQMDTCGAANAGFVARRAYTAASAAVDMVGHLHIDLCNQEKFLLNGVEMRVRLIRSRDSFAVMAAQREYKVNVTEANLLVRRCRINPSVLLAHSRALESGTAKYPITRVEVKAITLPAGVRQKTLDSVFLGQLPKRVVIGFVTNRAYNGHFPSNPFNFRHFNANYLALFVDGEQVPSGKPLQPRYGATAAAGNYVLAYHTLFSGTGIDYADRGNAVTRNDYPYGYCLTAFDLTPDMAAGDSGHWNLARNGNLRVEVGFGEALEAATNCIVYAEFDNVIELDRHRNAAMDFGG